MKRRKLTFKQKDIIASIIIAIIMLGIIIFSKSF